VPDSRTPVTSGMSEDVPHSRTPASPARLKTCPPAARLAVRRVCRPPLQLQGREAISAV
jgi:hypothetical protein